jgi:hypothetical protein
MNTYHHHTEAVFSIGWLFRCAMLCLAFGIACVGFLHQKEALHHKAEEVGKLERALRLLKRDNELKRREYSTLVSPKRLEEEVRKRHLDLVAPNPEDILSLPLQDPRMVRSNATDAEFPSDARLTMSRLALGRYTRRYLP